MKCSTKYIRVLLTLALLGVVLGLHPLIMKRKSPCRMLPAYVVCKVVKKYMHTQILKNKTN